MPNNNTSTAITDTARKLQEFWCDAVENDNPCFLSLEFRDGDFRWFMNNARKAPNRFSNAQQQQPKKRTTPFPSRRPSQPNPSPSPQLPLTLPMSTPTEKPPENNGPPQGASPMQLRSNTTGRKKRKHVESPENPRATYETQVLNVSSHQISGREYDAELVDNELDNVEKPETNSEDEDEHSVSSQDDEEEADDVSDHISVTCEPIIASDIFSPNKFAILSGENENLSSPGIDPEHGPFVAIKPVTDSNAGTPISYTKSPSALELLYARNYLPA